MSITTILFDLDGTLLPMDQNTFAKAYVWERPFMTAAIQAQKALISIAIPAETVKTDTCISLSIIH